MYLREFDPWKSRLCSCPFKYSINPYTGCDHRCLYCYASSYIKDFFRCRPKPILIETLKRQIKKIPAGSLISLCNTSDPYPSLEKQLKLTREYLKVFVSSGMRILIITKSSIVTRDIDLLKDSASAVTITITTLKHYKKLEPKAPIPSERFKAAEFLSKEGIPVGLRVDPIIPFLNYDEIEEILKTAKNCGVKHVTSSTFKPRWDSLKRMKKGFPEIMSKLISLYRDKVGNSWYLSVEIRKELMLRVRKICESLGLSFSCCREGFPELNTAASCDGSHLITR
ncbi:MAG: radical SAM protein [Thermodesulfovibrio sp.]|nr:radical SAM protein [Thermodesulfovibrio sp.]